MRKRLERNEQPSGISSGLPYVQLEFQEEKRERGGARKIFEEIKV